MKNGMDVYDYEAHAIQYLAMDSKLTYRLIKFKSSREENQVGVRPERPLARVARNNAKP